MDRIDEALKEVNRSLFLPGNAKTLADADRPIPIGYGQTNSQPTTVRMMLEWLALQPGEKVLDVGSGSGWTTALIAHIVGRDGEVYAVEKEPELVEFGKRNCQQARVENAHFFMAWDELGLPSHAPYDRVLVSASASTIPEELIDQLKVGGKLIVPVEQSIYEITKVSEKTYDQVEHPGFVFVPLL